MSSYTFSTSVLSPIGRVNVRADILAIPISEQQPNSPYSPFTFSQSQQICSVSKVHYAQRIVTKDLDHSNHPIARMKPFLFFPLLLSTVLSQSTAVCTDDLVTSDDCIDVVNPIACYNQFRWNAGTLSCIDGTDDADRKRKVRFGETRVVSG